MVYLLIDVDSIKLLSLKKTILGQQEAAFFEKKHEVKLLENNKIANVDLLASAIKEALNLASPQPLAKGDIYLILPQEMFSYLRTAVPADIAPTALDAFVVDKARQMLPVNLDECLSDRFVVVTEGQKVVTLYAIHQETVEAFRQTLSLIDLKLQGILPDTLAYFKLFEKTLRREKKETILYVFSDKTTLSAYLFDSWGLIDPKKWTVQLPDVKIEEVLKEKAQKLAEEKMKLNRIILSGVASEEIRQDTFTKSVGVWTNPLKRIIATFYKDYLKLLVVGQNKQFPLLNLDVCFGAFIFNTENKNFSLLKKGFRIPKPAKPLTLPSFPLPKKELAIFIGSFALSFVFFIIISLIKLDLNLPKITKPTPTPKTQPSPTPTPFLKKEGLKIKVLNGAGVAGKASEVKDILTNKEYGEILTGNADNFDYKITEINVKKDKAAATSLLKNDLKDYVTSVKIGELEEKSAADVVIIIGSDFK